MFTSEYNDYDQANSKIFIKIPLNKVIEQFECSRDDPYKTTNLNLVSIIRHTIKFEADP